MAGLQRAGQTRLRPLRLVAAADGRPLRCPDVLSVLLYRASCGSFKVRDMQARCQSNLIGKSKRNVRFWNQSQRGKLYIYHMYNITNYIHDLIQLLVIYLDGT